MSTQRPEVESSKTTKMEVNSPTGSISNEHSAADSIQEKQSGDAAPPADAADAEAAAKPAGPPNGGTRAWLQVVSAFVLFFNTWYGVLDYKDIDCYEYHCFPADINPCS